MGRRLFGLVASLLLLTACGQRQVTNSSSTTEKSATSVSSSSEMKKEQTETRTFVMNADDGKHTVRVTYQGEMLLRIDMSVEQPIPAEIQENLSRLSSEEKKMLVEEGMVQDSELQKLKNLEGVQLDTFISEDNHSFQANISLDMKAISKEALSDTEAFKDLFVDSDGKKFDWTPKLLMLNLKANNFVEEK